jgi:hypothetical protein
VDHLQELKKEFSRIERKDMNTIIDLIIKYGFRVSMFENMSIDSNNNFTSITKQSFINGKFTKTETDKILNYNIIGKNPVTIERTIYKYTNKLFKENVISSPFSIHDLQHYHITEKSKDMTISEFIKFSRSSHKNITTILNYVNIR